MSHAIDPCVDVVPFPLFRYVIEGEERRPWVLLVSPPDRRSSPCLQVTARPDQGPGRLPACRDASLGTASPVAEEVNGAGVEPRPIIMTSRDASTYRLCPLLSVPPRRRSPVRLTAQAAPSPPTTSWSHPALAHPLRVPPSPAAPHSPQSLQTRPPPSAPLSFAPSWTQPLCGWWFCFHRHRRRRRGRDWLLHIHRVRLLRILLRLSFHGCRRRCRWHLPSRRSGRPSAAPAQPWCGTSR